MTKKSFKKYLTALAATCALHPTISDASAFYLNFVDPTTGTPTQSGASSSIDLSTASPAFTSGDAIQFNYPAWINTGTSTTIGAIDLAGQSDPNQTIAVNTNSSFQLSNGDIISASSQVAGVSSAFANNSNSLLHAYNTANPSSPLSLPSDINALAAAVQTDIIAHGFQSSYYAPMSNVYSSSISLYNALSGVDATGAALLLNNIQTLNMSAPNTYNAVANQLKFLYNYIMAHPVPAQALVSLGSVYDSQIKGSQILFAVSPGDTLTLTGTNIDPWGNNPNVTVSSSSNSTSITGGVSYALYQVSPDGKAYYNIQTDSTGSGSIAMGNANKGTTGPYNAYSGISAFHIGSGGTLEVNATNGQPTILTQQFQDMSNDNVNSQTFGAGNPLSSSQNQSVNTTLSIQTPTTVTNPSVGGFSTISGSSNGSTLTLDVPNNVPTIFNNNWGNTDYNYLNLVLLSDATITNPTQVITVNATTTNSLTYLLYNDGAAQAITVGSAERAVNLTIKPNIQNDTTGTYNIGFIDGVYLANSNSSVTFDSTNFANAVFTFNYVGLGGTALTGPTDISGNVTLTATNHPIYIGTSIAGTVSFGVQQLAPGNFPGRLASFTINGTEDVTLYYGPNNTTVEIFTQQLTLDNPGTLFLPGIAMSPPSGTGDTATLTVSQSNNPNSVIFITGGAAGNNFVVNLGTNTLIGTYNTGSTAFSAPPFTPPPFAASSSLLLLGDVSINTTYNGTSVGNIVIDGSFGMLEFGAPNSPTTMAVNFDSGGRVLNVGQQLDIMSTTGGAMFKASGTQFTLNPSNVNQTATWTGTYGTNSNGDQAYYLTCAIAPPTPPPNTSATAATIVNLMTTPAATSTSEDGTQVQIFTPKQIEAINATASVDTVERFFSNAAALEVTNIAEIVNENAAGVHSMAINHQVASATGFSLNDLIPTHTVEQEGLGASAGDEHKRGAWITGSIQEVIQKGYGSTIGYKTRSYGATLGVDNKFTDDLLLGLAWTNATSLIKHRDVLNGNKARITTNVFSIYGLLTPGENWAVQGEASYGFSNTRVSNIRYNGTSATIARAKYKSYYYGGNLQLIRRFKPEAYPVSIEPMVGVAYSQFNDRPYLEDSGAVNWSVAKRSSYNIEALVGGKIVGAIPTYGWLLKPQITSYAHITLKDKRGHVHTSLDSLSGSVSFEQSKASKVWYSGGLGAFATKGNWEIGAVWELQLDKKYVAHQGTIKVRVEF